MALPTTGNYGFLTMKALIRKIQHSVYKPLLSAYLQKPRNYTYDGIIITISPGIFHPGFFYSTRFLLDELKKANLKGAKFLELGCGSGIISLLACKKKAIVTASDINPLAIKQLSENSRSNGLDNITLICSNLFEDLPSLKYDYIIINPPYFFKNPLTPADQAWYCGEHGEYFVRLFKQLGKYMHAHTQSWMVLSDQCNLQFIKQEAEKNNLFLQEINRKHLLLEDLFIFRLNLAQPWT